jgi:hypothetical protein
MPTPEQMTALTDLGVSGDQSADFFREKPIACPYVTESEPGIAALWYVSPRLSCGIVEITDPGGGVKTLARFREQARRLAASLGAAELELFGAEVLNAKLRQVLVRQGFEERVVDCPDELGDEKMNILARTFAL